MKNNSIVTTFLIIIVIILGIVIYRPSLNEPSSQNNSQSNSHDATYTIDGKKVTLINGISEVEAAPGSAAKIVTRYFGNELKLDLDDDGREDSAFLITQELGGSGMFYYVAARLNKVEGAVGSEAILLGDRISPQTTEMGKGKIIIVNYADRRPNESFTTPPSVGKSLWLLLDPQSLQWGLVEPNFSGEADPSRMSLGMKTWSWVSTLYNDGTSKKPRLANKFTLIFKDNGTFTATTDCNSVGGQYTTTGNKISFVNIYSTKMFCEGSQESDFLKMLGETESYIFTGKGELILEFKFDSGTMTLR